MRGLVTGALALIVMTAAAMADVAPSTALAAPVPLNQVSNPPDRLATARVTDADGTVIGAVQRVELRDDKPVRLDIALLASENTITLDASVVHYDAGTNVVTADESAARLMAHPKS